MDRRAPQVLSGTASPTTTRNESTSSYGPQPGHSGAQCPAVNSVCHGTTSVPDSATTDFSSTALWAVVIATLAAAAFMTVLLFYTRRRKRIRTRCVHEQSASSIPIHPLFRERIRALLWDVVHGVRDGTIEPIVLQRLIYGPDGVNAHLQSPELFEALLPVISQSMKLVNGGTGNDTLMWGEMQPLSLTPPHLPQESPRKSPVPSPGDPILQCPWRPPHAVDSTPPQQSDTPLQDGSKSEKKNAKGKRPFALWVERHVDAGVLIAMPRPPKDGSTTPLLIDCPIELGSASLTFQDNLLDAAIPPPTRFADLPGPRVVDPLSSALARHNRGGGGAPASRAIHPLSSVGRNFTLNTAVNTPHSQWAVRRGLGGGTAAG
jgi:hypothetical protein